jgi:hypothetical protein
MEVELSITSIRRLADELAPRVAKIIKADLQRKEQAEEWVRTEEAAAILGITERWLRRTKDNYPHIKNGDNKQGNLMFLRSGLIKSYAL